MTEQQWQECCDPGAMVDYLGDRLTDRKLRLLNCAWARRSWHLLTDERSRLAVEVAERFADGLASESELLRVHHAAVHAWMQIPEYQGSRRAMRRSDKVREAERSAAWVVLNASDHGIHARRVRNAGLTRPKTTAYLANVLRDLFGPTPLCPIEASPAWLTWNGGVVVALAGSIYQDWSTEQLPVLADALEDAGCTEARILTHLREPGLHVRGCWVVDLCLSRPSR